MKWKDVMRLLERTFDPEERLPEVPDAPPKLALDDVPIVPIERGPSWVLFDSFIDRVMQGAILLQDLDLRARLITAQSQVPNLKKDRFVRRLRTTSRPDTVLQTRITRRPWAVNLVSPRELEWHFKRNTRVYGALVYHRWPEKLKDPGWPVCYVEYNYFFSRYSNLRMIVPPEGFFTVGK